MHVWTLPVETALTVIGLLAFSLSGALMAVRKQMDVVGMLVLAAITALGGGVIRDLLIGVTPPLALRTWWWLAVPLLATVLTFFFHPVIARLRRGVLLFDAVGLGVFCAGATRTGLQVGLSPQSAVIVGVITGIGGGILRDVLAGEIPSVLRRDTQLYAVAAVAGCTVVAVAHLLGQDGVWVQLVAAAGIFALRMLALWRRWGAPAPRRRPS